MQLWFQQLFWQPTKYCLAFVHRGNFLPASNSSLTAIFFYLPKKISCIVSLGVQSIAPSFPLSLNQVYVIFPQMSYCPCLFLFVFSHPDGERTQKKHFLYIYAWENLKLLADGFFLKTLKTSLKWSISSGSLICLIKVSMEDFFREPIVKSLRKPV